MGKTTGIPWTDSTYNSWWGCTKVGPACDDCYAEAVDKRAGENHWGRGAPRRLLSEHARNEPYRWQRQADRFFAEHGRDRRVFTLSMGDLFDKEVDPTWRRDHFRVMTDCDRLRWQICTKRIGNLRKMVPAEWKAPLDWPRHVGVLITVVSQVEANRDVPRLLELKKRFGIPWIGISYEPAEGPIDWLQADPYAFGTLRVWLPKKKPEHAPDIRFSSEATLGGMVAALGGYTEQVPGLDWIIFGGKSGRNWNDRPFDLDWARDTRDQCADGGVAFFMKQVAAFRPADAMIPADLMVRQFPRALQ